MGEYSQKDRNLEFIGPFLLDSNENLWLPTPKDLLAVKDKSNSEDDNLDDQIDEWKRSDRISPTTFSSFARTNSTHPDIGHMIETSNSKKILLKNFCL